MIRLTKLLEGLPDSRSIFRKGENASMIKLVFWDDKEGLKDEKKRKEILRILERNLKVTQAATNVYKLSTSEIINDFKYYKETDKLIGNYPKYIFFERNKVGKVSMKNCSFKYELERVSKTLEIKEKTI